VLSDGSSSILEVFFYGGTSVAPKGTFEDSLPAEISRRVICNIGDLLQLLEEKSGESLDSREGRHRAGSRLDLLSALILDN
jgi:hypothetical protein